MRICCTIMMLALLLCGCTAEETMETVADDLVQPVMAAPREIQVQLPENAVAPVLESGEEQVYLCDGYEIIVETKNAGDVGATIRAVSGFDREELTVIETQWQDVSRYEFVWAAAGEKGDRLGRAVVLDDGMYHYCLSVLRDASASENTQIQWNDVFRSFTVV